MNQIFNWYICELSKGQRNITLSNELAVIHNGNGFPSRRLVALCAEMQQLMLHSFDMGFMSSALLVVKTI